MSEEEQQPDPKLLEMFKQLSLGFAILMIVLCCVGIVTNCLSLFIYTKKTFRKKSINVLLAALSATDLCVCVLAIPVFASTQLVQYFPIPVQMSAMIMVYLYPITIMFQSMSVWLLVSITVDRYLAVCHPFMVNQYCSRNRALLTVAAVVFFTVAYNSVRFWEYRIVNNATDIYAAVEPVLRDNQYFMLWYQNIATLLSQFLLPSAVLCILNFQVARTIIRASEQRRELVASVKREHSTAKMMIMVVIVFLVCYTFSFILNILEIIDKSIFDDMLGYFLNDINNVLVVVNSSSAFIFYYTYSTRYRNMARTMPGIRWFMSRSKFSEYDTEIQPTMTTRLKGSGYILRKLKGDNCASESIISMKGSTSTRMSSTHNLIYKSSTSYAKPCDI